MTRNDPTEFTAARLRRLADMEADHFWFSGRHAIVERLVRRHVRVARPRVLDGGCGTGRMVEHLIGLGHRAVGFDLRPEGLRGARLTNPATLLARGTVMELPFDREVFDAVLLLDVLEHVDDGRALREVARVLRPGGALILTVPALPWLWSQRDEGAGHRRRYTRRALRAVLRDAGLSVIVERYYQCILFPLALLSRLAGRTRVRVRDREDAPPRLLNRALKWINRMEARVDESFRWPWGTSLVCVCRERRP